MSKELARQEPTPGELMQQALLMPASDAKDRIEIIERLVALKERTDAQAQRNAFAAAMSAMQAELPQIDKRGKIMSGTGVDQKVRSTYARIEDLDAQVRPYLAKHGFSFSYNSEPAPAKDEIRFTGTMTHAAGHSEDKHIDMPIDTGGAKSKVQERSSTLSVAIRQLLRMHLNLITRDVDDDGVGNSELVSAKDLAEITARIEATETDLAKFLAFVKAEKLEDIQRRDVPRALSLLRAKATVKKEEAKE